LKNTAVRISNLARIIYKILVIYTAIVHTVFRAFTHRDVCLENYRRERMNKKKKRKKKERRNKERKKEEIRKE
jgi:hypothetical protein